METTTKDLIKFDSEELPINLEPAKIDFPKYEELKKRVTKLTDGLKDYVVTADSYEQDKKTRAELNRVQKALSKKRIEIFNKAVGPANEFKQQVSGLEKQIKCASDRISEGIKHYTDKEKDEKFQEIKLRLGNLALKYNVSIQLLGDIRKKDNQFNHWLNKSCSWRRIETEAKEFFQTKAENQKLKATLNQVVIDRAKSYDKPTISPNPYLEMLNYKDLDQVLVQMAHDHEDAVNREKQRQIENRKATEAVERRGDKYVDTNTGEVVDSVHSMSLRFYGSTDQLDKLVKYARKLNISFEKVK